MRSTRAVDQVVHAVRSGSEDLVLECWKREKGCIDCFTNSNNKGTSPLFEATRLKKLDIVKLLLDQCGANVQIQSPRRGETALHMAVTRVSKDSSSIGDLDPLVEALVVAGACVDVPDASPRGCTPLSIACEKGHLTLVKYLWQHLSTESSTCGCGEEKNKTESLLLLASQNGHYEIVRFLLEQNADWAKEDEYYHDAFLAACAKGYLDVVLVFLSLDPTIDISMNVDGQDDNTPFFVACRQGHLHVVDVLLQHSKQNKSSLSRLDKITKSGTPLCAACRHCHPRVAALLLWKGGARVHVKVPGTGETPLHLAASHRLRESVEAVDLLLGKGADAQAKTRKGESALYRACRANNWRVVSRLLQTRGGLATVNEPTNENWTPLLAACKFSDARTVKKLLEAGADVHVRGADGETVLCVAAGRSRHSVSLTNLLLQSGADATLANDNGETPLHIAGTSLLYGDTEWRNLVDVLVAHGADVNAVTVNGTTALWDACHNKRYGNFRRMAYLIRKLGADTTIVDAQGCTLLHCVCQHWNLDRLRLLMGADEQHQIPEQQLIPVDIVDKSGETCLHAASRSGQFNAIAFLVKEHSATMRRVVDWRNGRGETALLLACQQRKLLVVQQLLRLGADASIGTYRRDGPCTTPLLEAATSNNVDMVRDLLLHGGTSLLGEM